MHFNSPSKGIHCTLIVMTDPFLHKVYQGDPSYLIVICMNTHGKLNVWSAARKFWKAPWISVGLDRT